MTREVSIEQLNKENASLRSRVKLLQALVETQEMRIEELLVKIRQLIQQRNEKDIAR